MRRTVSVEFLQSGQARPYADTIYEAVLTFSAEPYDWHPGESKVRELAKVLVHEFFPEETPGYWLARLTEIERQAPDRWRVKIVRPYDD